MNDKRYLVRGKRIDTGELVEGYYAELGLHKIILTGDIVGSIDDYLDWERYEVDPATVERVAVKVIKQKTLVGDYICPNCKAAFIDGMDTTPYCGNCGQRLDWQVSNE